MQAGRGHLRAVLAGDDHRVHPRRAAVAVLHGDLALSVGAQVGQRAVFAHLGQALGQLVGQADGQRHQFGGLVAGKAEHHALVAGAGHLVVGAQRDVGALVVDVGDDAAGIAVKAVLGAVVADVPDDLAGNAGDVHIAAGGDLAHDVDQAGGAGGLAGDAGAGVLFQDGVQHRVGDLVTDLVGMPLGDGFGCEQNFGHRCFLPVSWRAGRLRAHLRPAGPLPWCGLLRKRNCRDRFGVYKTKGAQVQKSLRARAYLSVPRRNWHLTLSAQVAGLHRACSLSHS